MTCREDGGRMPTVQTKRNVLVVQRQVIETAADDATLHCLDPQ